MVVIEMNPRVSRSSALASKATGFPIAKIAAKLAVGYTLDELQNDITKVTPASFEPTIDYVVTKIPRFAFEKFPGAEPLLTTSMKSVGEAMAIGRTFGESLQKALRSLETGLTGFDEIALDTTIPTPSAPRWPAPRRTACALRRRRCATTSRWTRSSASPATIPGSWARSKPSCRPKHDVRARRPAQGRRRHCARLKSHGLLAMRGWPS